LFPGFSSSQGDGGEALTRNCYENKNINHGQASQHGQTRTIIFSSFLSFSILHSAFSIQILSFCLGVPWCLGALVAKIFY
jgi:hypothetical protein